MPQKSIDREYYRNGQRRLENRKAGGMLHGLSRTWHSNGQLAEEHPYHHGNLHGISRQWDENGQLLGSFSIKHGTGRQRFWHNNGQLRLEIDCLNGKFFGRTRLWLRDGTLVQETFHINNVAVTRTTYFQAARKDPAWPQYGREPAGRVVRETVALKRKQHELFIQSLLEKSHAEARKWLAQEQSAPLRSLAGFRTAATALRFVDELYAAGAKCVFVAPIYQGKHKKSFADSLLVKLPRVPSKRKVIRRMCQNFCLKQQGALLPERDLGESHLFLGLA